INIQKTTYTNNNLQLLSYNYFDGFGRLIQTQEKGEGNAYIVTSKNYDSRGNIKTDFLPLENFLYESEFIPINTNDLATHFSYDALNRIKTIKDSLGITQSIYGAWNKKIVDKNGNKKEFYFDAYENLIEVKEFLNDQSFSTFYKYDTNNNLIRVTDPQGNFRILKYDFQGNLLSEEDLHSPSLSDVKKKQYTYDDNGNLIRFKNQANEKIVYEYDELDRITKEQLFSDSESVNFFYDTADYGIGKIAQIETPYIKKIFSYDILGRIVKEERVLEEQSYFTNFSYDVLGNILSILYPDNTRISYNYNNLGLPEKILYEEKVLIKNIEYNHLKQISKIEYGNGLITDNLYDPLGHYRLTQKITRNSFNNSQLQDFSYDYDAVGNFTGLNDNSPFSKKIVSYAYDDLDRLLKADYSGMSEENDFSESYAYDILGNILEKSGQGSYLYNTVQPHAVTQVGDTKYAYDEKGNMIYDGSSNYAFNTKNQLISSEKNSKKMAYLYDENGIRIKKEDLNSGKNTLYVNRFYETSGNETKRFIYLGDMKLATLFDRDMNAIDPECAPPEAGVWTIAKSCTFTGKAAAKDIIVQPDVVLTVAEDSILYMDFKNNKLLIKNGSGVLIKKGASIKQGLKSDVEESYIITQLAYHHSDHLGGASIDTDADANVLQSIDYYPFGETHVSKNTSSYKNNYAFTGQELDEDTGLYYYKARYYHPEIGRFLSLDPWAGDISDPQTLNKYSYTRNNPLKYIDPSGESPIDMQRIWNNIISGSGKVEYNAIRNFPSNSVDFAKSSGYSAIDTALFDILPNQNYESGSIGALGAKFGIGIGITAGLVIGKNFFLGKSAIKSSEKLYTPNRKLPRDKDGNPIPDVNTPHTQIGTRSGSKGEEYRQTREWGYEDGQIVHKKDIDWTNHGRPKQHYNPHVHRYEKNATGGTRKRSTESYPLNN
ncbi:RHS repeat-associated core domain-containing protein, partial [Candidatus Peregrinibacteria bacterium]|nr:RHS repeat-associated core domain-containing protein [Candidatus Peregrinibacteria bacterium]